MSMTKMECFIEQYLHINQNKMYSLDAYEYEVLECLGDLDKALELLYEYQDEINSREVDNLLSKYSLT